MLHIYIYIYLTTYVVKHYATTFQQQHINNQHAGAVIRRSPTSPASGWTSCSSRWYNQCPRPDRGGGDGCTSPASPSACWHPPPFSAHTRWDDFSEIYWPVFVFLPWWAPDCICALCGSLYQLWIVISYLDELRIVLVHSLDHCANCGIERFASLGERI